MVRYDNVTGSVNPHPCSPRWVRLALAFGEFDVHLATAELLGEPPLLMTIVTRDDRVRENAEALG